MPDIDILVLSAKPVFDALSPTVEFEIQVTNRGTEAIADCLLNYEVYMKIDEKKLFWGTAITSIGGFASTSPANRKIRLSCGYDANLTVGKNLEAVGEGEIPIEITFSGTCFWGNQSSHIKPTTKATSIPTSTWRTLVLSFYRYARWIMITPDTLKILEKFRDEWQLHTFDEVIRELVTIKSEKSK